MPTKLTVYYAHPMALYGSPVEKKDLKTLVALGFKIINPALPQYRDYQMDDFVNLARRSDVVAFRSFEDGKVGSGVYLEVMAAMQGGIPVIELTPFLPGRVLNRNETRQRMCLPPLRHPDTAPIRTVADWDEYPDEYADMDFGDQ